MQTPTGNDKLIRGLGLKEASSIIVGTMIGTGIFLVPNTIARDVQTPGMVFAVWIITGLLSLMGALTYAELGTAFPKVGGEYVYLSRAYGSFWGFLYGWTQFGVMKAGSIAGLASGFAIYLGHFVPLSEVERKITALACIFLLSAVNYRGVQTGGAVQTVLTFLKVAIVLVLAVFGFALGAGTTIHYTPILPDTFDWSALNLFGIAMVAALWGYDGWNNTNMVAGEVKDPTKNIPRSLILGTFGVMLIYLLANFVYLYILPLEAIRNSDRVAAEIAQTVIGPQGASIISAAILLSIIAALNGSILSGARIFYAMASDGLFFKRAALVHDRFRSPHYSIIFQGLWASVLALSGTFDQLITYVIFASWVFYGMTTVSCIYLRKKFPDIERPYKTPGYPVTPIIFGALAFLLTINTLIGKPEESLIGLALMLTGVPAYWFWKRKVTTQPTKHANNATG
jgi:amino acid transporter